MTHPIPMSDAGRQNARDQWQRHRQECIDATMERTGRTISTLDEWMSECNAAYDEYGIEPEPCDAPVSPRVLNSWHRLNKYRIMRADLAVAAWASVDMKGKWCLQLWSDGVPSCFDIAGHVVRFDTAGLAMKFADDHLPLQKGNPLPLSTIHPTHFHRG